MATPKSSGLARFTRQGQASPPAAQDDPSSRATHRGTPAGGTAETRAEGTAADASAPEAGRGAVKPKLVGVYVMPDGHRQLKVEAAKRGATVSDLVREALNAWFANEHLPPLA